MHSIISIREYQFAPQTRRDTVDITFIHSFRCFCNADDEGNGNEALA